MHPHNYLIIVDFELVFKQIFTYFLFWVCVPVFLNLYYAISIPKISDNYMHDEDKSIKMYFVSFYRVISIFFFL